MSLLQPSFDAGRRTIFIFGGSQGSRFISALFKAWVEQTGDNARRIQVIHQVGLDDPAGWENFYKGYDIPAYVFSYRDAIEDCYRACDLVVARGGAGSLFELVFFNKPAIIVPLVTKATHHQVANAQTMAKRYPSLFTYQKQESIDKNLPLFSEHIAQILFEEPA